MSSRGDRPHWTIESLREHFEALLAANDLRQQQRFDAQQQALRDALAANEKRLDGMNEIRGQLDSQARTFMPRPEADQRFGAMEQRIGKIEAMQTRVVGRGEGKSASTTALLAVVGLLIAVIGVIVAFFRH
jgi:preprotein translocase subunit SecF